MEQNIKFRSPEISLWCSSTNGCSFPVRESCGWRDEDLGASSSVLRLPGVPCRQIPGIYEAEYYFKRFLRFAPGVLPLRGVFFLGGRAVGGGMKV